MNLDEKALGELCVRVANGDEQARRDFERYVLPVVETIAGRWLRQQKAKEFARPDAAVSTTSSSASNSFDVLPEVAAALCAQMVAEAAGKQRTRRQPISRKPKLTPGETISALVERHTVSWLAPWPA